MSNWKYKVQSSPRDIISKLETAFVPDSGFIVDEVECMDWVDKMLE